jgi:hypothetical protein
LNAQFEEEVNSAILESIQKVTPRLTLIYCALLTCVLLAQQRDDLAALLTGNLEEIAALEEEREQNFTLLMNAFARVDQLAKSVFGEQIYSLLLDSMKATASQVGQVGPLPMVFGVGQNSKVCFSAFACER